LTECLEHSLNKYTDITQCKSSHYSRRPFCARLTISHACKNTNHNPRSQVDNKMAVNNQWH